MPSKKYGTVKIKFGLRVYSKELLKDLETLALTNTKTISEPLFHSTPVDGNKSAWDVEIGWRHTARNYGSTRSDAEQRIRRVIGKRRADFGEYTVLDQWQERPDPQNPARRIISVTVVFEDEPEAQYTQELGDKYSRNLPEFTNRILLDTITRLANYPAGTKVERP